MTINFTTKEVKAFSVLLKILIHMQSFHIDKKENKHLAQLSKEQLLLLLTKKHLMEVHLNMIQVLQCNLIRRSKYSLVARIDSKTVFIIKAQEKFLVLEVTCKNRTLILWLKNQTRFHEKATEMVLLVTQIGSRVMTYTIVDSCLVLAHTQHQHIKILLWVDQ